MAVCHIRTLAVCCTCQLVMRRQQEYRVQHCHILIGKWKNELSEWIESPIAYNDERITDDLVV